MQEISEFNGQDDTEKRLRESEQSLNALLNSSPDQIWLVDRDYCLVRANRSFFEIMKKLYGLDLQVGQKLFFSQLSDHTITQWKTLYDRAFQGDRFTVEYVGEPGLEANDYEVTFNPVYDQGQDIVGAVCFSREFVAQNKTQHLFRQSESQLAEAQKLAQWGTWNYDLLENKVTWSKEMYKVFGTDEDTFQHTHANFIHQVHEEDKERVLQTSLRAQEDGTPFEVEYRISTPSGEARNIHELGYAERNGAGKVVRLFGTAQNVTLHKKAAEDVKLAYRQLRELAAHFQTIRSEERSKIEREIQDSLDQQLAVLRLDTAWIKGMTSRGMENHSRIALPTTKGYIFVQVRDIVRCQSENTYTTFFTKDKRKLVICKNLKECEALLRDFNFFRVHNSHMINLEYVDEYLKGEGGTVRMSDGSFIDVSRRKKDEFIRLFRKP